MSVVTVKRVPKPYYRHDFLQLSKKVKSIKDTFQSRRPEKRDSIQSPSHFTTMEVTFQYHSLIFHSLHQGEKYVRAKMIQVGESSFCLPAL